MNPLTKFACSIAFTALCAGCNRDASHQEEAQVPPPPAPVDAGPQAPAGEPSDYQVVMDALNGKRAAPAGAAEEPNFSDVAGTLLQVRRMACVTEHGVPAHCHMTVRQDQDHPDTFLPDRKLVILQTSPGNYSLMITSAQMPDESIVCIGLHRLDNDPRTIKGTCGISGAPDGNPVHKFAATIERTAAGKIRITFGYRHKDFDSPDDPVHNGDGHAETN